MQESDIRGKAGREEVRRHEVGYLGILHVGGDDAGAVSCDELRNGQPSIVHVRVFGGSVLGLAGYEGLPHEQVGVSTFDGLEVERHTGSCVLGDAVEDVGALL